MTAVERIIERFGGLSALARALGHRHPTTVQGWKQRGIIPARQQQQVLAAAQREGIALNPADLFDDPADDPADEPATADLDEEVDAEEAVA
jgi:hypothetical protein